MLSHPWISGLDLQQLHTPLDRCVGVWPGKVDRAVVEDLRRYRFDQAPVFGSPAGAIVVSTEDLERLLESGELLHNGHGTVRNPSLSGGVGRSSRGLDQHLSILGLNRHPFRTSCEDMGGE